MQRQGNGEESDLDFGSRTLFALSVDELRKTLQSAFPVKVHNLTGKAIPRTSSKEQQQESREEKELINCW